MYLTLLQCILMLYDGWKNSKPFEIVNFTGTSVISDCILSILWYSPEIGTRVDFLKLEFSIFSYVQQISFRKCSKIFKTFVTGIFSYLFYKCRKSIWWTKLLFFQVLREIFFSIKIDWLGFHTKSDSSFRLMKIFWSIYQW